MAEAIDNPPCQPTDDNPGTGEGRRREIRVAPWERSDDGTFYHSKVMIKMSNDHISGDYAPVAKEEGVPMNVQEILSRPHQDTCARCGAVSSEGLCGRCEQVAAEQEELTEAQIDEWIENEIEERRLRA